MSNKKDEIIGPTIGPESAPIRDYVTTFILVIMVIDLANDDKVIRKEKIDYGKHEHRKFLGRLTFWACSHGYSIETMSEEDYNKYHKE